MQVSNWNVFSDQNGSLEAAWDAALLGRLSSELAHVYHDVLEQPIPHTLQALIHSLDRDGGQTRMAASSEPAPR